MIRIAKGILFLFIVGLLFNNLPGRNYSYKLDIKSAQSLIEEVSSNSSEYSFNTVIELDDHFQNLTYNQNIYTTHLLSGNILLLSGRVECKQHTKKVYFLELDIPPPLAG